MTFSEKLKLWRKELHLTQAEMAEVLEVPSRTLWDWEHGRSIPFMITEEGAIARLTTIQMKRLDAAIEDS